MESILDGINSPEDIRRLDIPQLVVLAQEIRHRIIEVVSRNGGHLAPNLGAVELALTLHYVFDTPRDKIVWDVGHQTYTHKLITGRREEFHSLGQFKGLPKFLRRVDSPYDVFGAGHASTSISSALGIACARDLAREKFAVVAVIGDGAMSAGLAFEGLNNAGASGRDLIVVLNDNEMSISRTVGALSRHLTDLITGSLYNRLRADIWELTGRFPRVGQRVRTLVRRIDDGLKGLIVPGMLFEQLGFRYFGPIDGHNQAQLIKTFKQVKKLSGPILVHVLTKKGKGYKPAEENPLRFHGVGPFEVATGNLCSMGGIPTYSEVFGKTLVKLAEKDEKILGITAAMADSTGLDLFAERFPERFFDVGIAEQHAITFAAGLASQGYRPVAAVYSTFLQRAYDQIVHDVALQRLPVILAIDRAGVVGEDGPTHHGSFDISYLRHIPNLMIMAPKDENELRHMLKTAISYDEGPVVLRYPRGKVLGVPLSPRLRQLQVGTSEVLKDGCDLFILAIGSMVYPSLKAAQLLEEEGISVGVVNMRFVRPLDVRRLQELCGRVERLVTVEENVLSGGFGSAVLEYLQSMGLGEVGVIRLGLPNDFVEHGSREVLLKEVGLDAQGIAQAIKSELERGWSWRVSASLPIPRRRR